MPPRKRTIAEINTVLEPRLSDDDNVTFNKGIEFFNQQRYWDAHETWEEIWQELGNGPEDDWEIILRGFIQFAAALHGQAVGKREMGVGNLLKAKSKLGIHQRPFLGIQMKSMVNDIEGAMDVPQKLFGYQIHRRSL